MTVYLLKNCSGSYEDYTETIVYCSTNKDKVQLKKLELEKQQELDLKQSEKCIYCEADVFHKDKCACVKDFVNPNCDNFEMQIDNDGDVCYCKNYVCLSDESTFIIEEIECEE